jgi:hypothetical protein
MFFKHCVSWKETSHVIQADNRAGIIGKKFVSDPLNFATEFQVRQFPSLHLDRFHKQTFCFTLEIKQRHVFVIVFDCVRYNGFLIDPEESAAIILKMFSEDQFPMTCFEEFVEIARFV